MRFGFCGRKWRDQTDILRRGLGGIDQLSEGGLHLPSFAIPHLWKKALLEGAIVPKRVYNVGSREAKSSIPAREEKAMFSHGSRILAVIATAVLIVGVHSVRAADFAGSVQGAVKSASGQALS